jgi:GNAT superfamily N-acetyltransferase
LEWITPEESAANWAKNFNTEQSLNAGMYIFVAEAQLSGIVGFARLSPLESKPAHIKFIDQGYSHELRSLQVLPAWQKNGIGKQLISKVADQVTAEGGTRLLVKMLLENPNMGYYEHLGAVRLGTNSFSWDGYQTQEIIFGWKSLDSLSNV